MAGTRSKAAAFFKTKQNKTKEKTKMSWNTFNPPSLPSLSRSWLCWWVDNGMRLNLLLISALMCVIKYITTSQLANTRAIHHFNWYPPQTTWVHPRVPAVFARWLFLRLHGREQKVFFFICILLALTDFIAHICGCVCTCVLGLIACRCSCPPPPPLKCRGTPENRNAAFCYVSHDANVFCLLNGNTHWDANSIQTCTFCSGTRA